MRAKQKKQFLSILQTMKKINALLDAADESARSAVLQDCIDACNALGGKGERDTSESAFWAHLQECRTALEALRGSSADHARLIQELQGKTEACIEVLGKLPAQKQIVFMPYKTAVWDSLESVYLAAKEDESCEVKLVPIPYYSINMSTGEKSLCYEGDAFPRGEEVTHYSEYDLETERPEVIYIHNPYDQYNRVTNVVSDYFSENLKKYTDCLVYIPYYVTSGFFAADHRRLSVYRHMDYMICQSKHFKKVAEMDNLPYVSRMLPLGSPKLDHVIRMCRGGYVVPEDWKPVLAGKKSVMLNTSLNCVLANTRAYLEKLRYIFEHFREISGIVLIWRPHPLLFSTLQSMRPEYYGQYLQLKECYVNEKTGIYDETPDVENTIGIVDAYIGEMNSSVVNLFGAAGKPLFILNNSIRRSWGDSERRRIIFLDIVFDGGTMYGLTSMGVWRCRAEGGQWMLEGVIDRDNMWQSPVVRMINTSDRLLLCPYNHAAMLYWDKSEKAAVNMRGWNVPENILAARMVLVSEKVYYITAKMGCLIEYNLRTQQRTEYRDCILAMARETAGQKFEDACDLKADDSGNVWMCATHSNCVVCFHTGSREMKVYEIGDRECGFSTLVIKDNLLWLGEVNSGAIYQYDCVSGSTAVIRLPASYQIRECAYGRALVHFEFVDFGDFFVSVPYLGSHILKIQKSGGDIQILAEDFTEALTESTIFYDSSMDPPFGFAGKKGTQLVVQRSYDGRMAFIDCKTGAVAEYEPPVMTAEDYHTIKTAGDGFERVDTCTEFARYESAFFDLDEFLGQLAAGELEGVRDRQIRALGNMAENMDGTCGEKVHQEIMKRLA